MRSFACPLGTVGTNVRSARQWLLNSSVLA
jgi:hypothetical protein